MTGTSPDTPPEISLEESPTRGRYLYRRDGHEAELTYSRAGTGLVILDHTAVPDAFRGQGIGQALVARAVADARASGLRILPLCPFAAAQFRRHPDWADVLDANRAGG